MDIFEVCCVAIETKASQGLPMKRLGDPLGSLIYRAMWHHVAAPCRVYQSFRLF